VVTQNSDLTLNLTQINIDGTFAAIQVIAAEGLPVDVACRVLGVSVSGYYEWRNRAPSPRSLRHAWLTELILRVHGESRGYV
jgi:hypothetical protein